MQRDSVQSDAVIEQLHFQTAADLVEALRRTHPRWDDDLTRDTGWVFRGQRDSRWPLVPPVFRQSSHPLLLTYQRIVEDEWSDKNWKKWVGRRLKRPSDVDTTTWRRRLATASEHALTHAATVRDFILLALNTGHSQTPCPGFLWHVFDAAKHSDCLRNFFYGEIHNDDMVAFAIAQHHGVPTGLLDWTYNPLVAAFFAAEKLIQLTPEIMGSSLAVWSVRTKLFRLDLKDLRRLTVPPLLVPFLDAQEGLFTWSPTMYSSYLLHGSYPTFEEVIRRIAQKEPDAKLPLLRRLTLPVSEARELLRLLWREKMTRAHLMPTYDNVTTSLHLMNALR